MNTVLSSPSTVTDLQSLQNLRRAAREDPAAATKEVAQQFEALFVKMMLKSMRDASFGDTIFGSEQMDAYQDMFDNQMALHLSKGQGIGLADVIERQLNGVNNIERTKAVNNYQVKSSFSKEFSENENITLNNIALNNIAQNHLKLREVSVAVEKYTVNPVTVEELSVQEIINSPTEFVQKLWPIANKVSEKSGISTEILLAQAALETGWGKAISRDAAGKNSFNLFNIKADHRWDGERITKLTVEYKDGVTEKQTATFRSYRSYEESFQDFISFISAGPRYQNAIKVIENNEKFITELQRSGYATDPLYAEKVLRVLSGKEMKNALSDIKI